METYNSFSETFSNSRKNMKWPEMEYFMDFIKTIPEIADNNGKIQILDIGCGNGRLLNYLIPAGLDKSYFGIDSSDGMISEAIREFPDHKFELLDMTDLSGFDGEKFDMIFLIASFHHLKTLTERQEVLSHINGILRSGGFVFMTNWNLFSEENSIRYKEITEGSGNFDIKIGEYMRYYHGFNLDELKGLFDRSHFEIIENRIFDNGRNIISILRKG
ncbi:MAG: class I SAM-dependent methyltransferase [Candidatus Gracilibacteria bacterium]|nr:class I SAM-dependent methyltransferase [Candidatus Gracilibacteria bacterium]